MLVKKYNFKSVNIYLNCIGIKIEIIYFFFFVICERLFYNISGLKNFFVIEGIIYLNIVFFVLIDYIGVIYSGYRKLVFCNCE